MEDDNSEDTALIEPGKRLEIPRRARETSNNLTGKGNELRTKLDNRLKNSAVNPANPNITTGTFVGAIGTVIVWLAEDYLPGRVGAEASVSGVDVGEDVITYTLDTDGAIESQARFRSILDAGTGVVSIWTDEIEVTSVETIKERPARDTFRYEIKVTRD